MFDKKKINFLRLAVIFSSFIIITLFFLWSAPNKQQASMMPGSMGNTMAKEHLNNITIYDLLKLDEMKEQANSSTEAHHDNSALFQISSLTTGIIFLLLPLIVGGSIVLAIVWIK